MWTGGLETLRTDGCKPEPAIGGQVVVLISSSLAFLFWCGIIRCPPMHVFAGDKRGGQDWQFPPWLRRALILAGRIQLDGTAQRAAKLPYLAATSLVSVNPCAGPVSLGIRRAGSWRGGGCDFERLARWPCSKYAYIRVAWLPGRAVGLRDESQAPEWSARSRRARGNLSWLHGRGCNLAVWRGGMLGADPHVV